MTAPQRQAPHRLAVVDPVGNDGGGSRFLRALLPALHRVRPDMQITLLGRRASLRREGVTSELRAAGIDIQPLQSLRLGSERLLGIPGTRLLAAKVQPRLRGRASGLPAIVTGDLEAELAARLREFDVAYFAWPYGFAPPKLSCAAVATIHDLNFKYFFGSAIWTPEALETFDAQIQAWLDAATIVVSSQFMATEVRRFYGQDRPLAVIPLASFAGLQEVTPAHAASLVAAMGIEGRYILCPTHAMTHKNLGPLIAAMALVLQEEPDLKLVFTGNGTDSATGHATPIGSERATLPVNVIGLGYVSNAEVDALISRASVVVNPSLYEAGNGSGIDAWRFGVPVAMSDIAPFREHLDQGYPAELFDPRDPVDIARSIRTILGRTNPDEIRDRAVAAAATHTWDRVARDYLEVIDAAWMARRAGPAARSHGVASGG